jgi:hypothetical protein
MQRARRYSGLITEEQAAKRRDPSKQVNHSLKFPSGLVTASNERRRRKAPWTLVCSPGALELRRLMMQLQQGFAIDGMGTLHGSNLNRLITASSQTEKNSA